MDYGGIVASSVMIIIPELIFYGLFQKKIVGGMVATARSRADIRRCRYPQKQQNQ